MTTMGSNPIRFEQCAEIGKQATFKLSWVITLKSSSLFTAIEVLKLVDKLNLGLSGHSP
jgi:hypothetical protein